MSEKKERIKGGDTVYIVSADEHTYGIKDRLQRYMKNKTPLEVLAGDSSECDIRAKAPNHAGKWVIHRDNVSKTPLGWKSLEEVQSQDRTQRERKDVDVSVVGKQRDNHELLLLL